MTELFAQPYDSSAQGFYFTSVEEYHDKSANTRNSLGFRVEEYEIQFIDGDDIGPQLFKALGINQSTIGKFFDVCEEWDDRQKQKAIIAIGECGYSFDLECSDPDDFEVDIYEMETMRELAEYFVEEGMFGEIPEQLQHYLDYDAIARDLGIEYSETTIAGKGYIYRCF